MTDDWLNETRMFRNLSIYQNQKQISELQKQNQAFETQSREIAQLAEVRNKELQLLKQQREEAKSEKQRLADLPKCSACLSPLEDAPQKCRHCGTTLEVAIVAKSPDLVGSENILSVYEHVPNRQEDFAVKIFYHDHPSFADQVREQASALQSTIQVAAQEIDKLSNAAEVVNARDKTLEQRQRQLFAKDFKNEQELTYWCNYAMHYEKSAIPVVGTVLCYLLAFLSAVVAAKYMSGEFEAVVISVAAGGSCCLFGALGSCFHWCVRKPKSRKFKSAVKYVVTQRDWISNKDSIEHGRRLYEYHQARGRVATCKLAALRHLRPRK